MRILIAIVVAVLVSTCGPLAAQVPAACDRDRTCVGNALTIDRTSGRGAQYVDVDASSALTSLDTALTFEAWLLPVEQPGRRAFVAGLWGPNRDDNDQWVVFIENTTVTFALSPTGSKRGDADNTVVSASVPDLYTRGWVHVAAVWDGATTQARLFIDGVPAGVATNAQYPLRRLHRVANPSLPLQIASCNGLFDDATRNRTFRGQMDEVRIWGRALDEREVRCQRTLSLEGNEPRLLLYYRCNEASTAAELCDATGRNARGRLRSGAACSTSTRTVPATFVVTPSSVAFPLYCTGDTTLTFQIVDTSSCGSRVQLAVSGPDRALFTPSAGGLSLLPGVPQTFTVGLRAIITGSISATLEITNVNRCGEPVTIPLTATRTTDLRITRPRLVTDTLFVGCLERTYAEDTVEICNGSGAAMRVYSASLADTVFRFRAADPARPLPVTLAPGECWRGIVRTVAFDTTRTSYDTLRFVSDDRCGGSGVVPIQGHSQDVLGLLSGDGRRRLGPLSFGSVCPGQISDVGLFQLRSLVGDTVKVDTIIYPPDFYGRRLVYPLPLAPATAGPPEYMRYRPSAAGPASGIVRFRASYRGCTIEKTVAVSGRGISVNLAYAASLLGFGNVTVGTTATQVAPVTNRGDDRRRVSAYLKVGDAFRIVSGRSFSIDPGATQTVGVEFRPREPRVYYDTLCIFDEQCYGTMCIPVTGTGVTEALAFEPALFEINSVPGCQCADQTVRVRNASGAPLTIASATLSAPRFTLQSGPVGIVLAPGESAEYTIRYCPDDLQDDRADQTTLDLQLAGGGLYQILVRATSVVPRLLVTPLTTFGAVEVGWSQTQQVLVENISASDIRIDVPPTLPTGYTLISTTPTLPAVLRPRDSLWLEIRFAPTSGGAFNGPVTVASTSPCTISQAGQLAGSGIVIKLDLPISFVNYGLVKPCDCAVREIPLPNNSNFIPISVDSVWIDGQGVTSARPQVFVWRSRQTGGTTTPYQIAPGTRDTLQISFCPNIPALNANVLSNATLHVKASTPGWNQEFRTTLSGRREVNFQPNRTTVAFPATRVDTSATPITVDLAVPDAFANPSGDSVVITDLAFLPDQRVFSVRAQNNAPLPWVIRRGQRFPIVVGFYPRAPRAYSARLQITTSFPCAGLDTTILVRGEGFAPAYGLTLAFDTARTTIDTFGLTTCDTLVLPIMTTRPIPQETIDIGFRIGYDATLLRPLDLRSRFTASVTFSDTGDGARGRLFNARNVGPDTLAVARFVVVGGPGTSPLTLDSLEFDSDSLVFFKIVAVGDRGVAVIDRPRIAIGPIAPFDTVNVRTCADRTVWVSNPGTLPVRFDSLSGLPAGHRVVASSRPLPTTLQPDDSVEVTIRFCAFREEAIDVVIAAVSSDPCDITDTTRVTGLGYAPPFPFRILFSTSPDVRDTVRGAIADTVEVSLHSDRDVPQSPLDMDLALRYNRRSLQLLGVSSAIAGAAATEEPTGLRLSLTGANDIRAGELARLRFAVAVPDTVVTAMVLDAGRSSFASDSAFWVRLTPTGDTAAVVVDPKCTITRLDFPGGMNRLSAAAPNPATSAVGFDLDVVDDAPARIVVLNAAGIEVLRALDGDRLDGGARYRITVDVSRLASGVYYCLFENGRFRATERFVVTR